MKLFKQYIYPRLILDLTTFYIPLMIFGIIAARLQFFSVQVLLGLVANYLMIIFAFIYNDVEDVEADAKYIFEPLSFLNHMRMNLAIYEQEKGKRRFQNPFSNGMLTRKDGFNILMTLIITSLVISIFVGGLLGFFIAVSNIIVGVLYSGGMVQFKSMPLIDVLSHCYLLAGVQIIYFMVFQNASVDIYSFILLLSVMGYSIGGDLWNEYRDFDSDQAAGLKNTASILGKKRTLLANKILCAVSLIGIVISSVIIVIN